MVGFDCSYMAKEFVPETFNVVQGVNYDEPILSELGFNSWSQEGSMILFLKIASIGLDFVNV